MDKILSDIKGQVSKMTVNEKQQLVSQIRTMQDAVISRSELSARLGKSFGDGRELYKVCGYPTEAELVFSYYEARFSRQEIAKRIISAPVFATWRQSPEVYEDEDPLVSTPFEKAWSSLVKKRRLYHYIRRLDTLAGIGQYSVLLLGFNDGQDLSTEVFPGKGRELLFVQPYSEVNATINLLDADSRSERFNLPLNYQIKMVSGTNSTIQQLVHWSRIIHVADGLLENDVYGIPRLQCVYNRLQDLETISAGSAEMFWQGAFPGIIFSTDAEADPDAQTIAQMDDEIVKYIHKLRRYMRMQGVTPHQLLPAIKEPTEFVMVQLRLISSGTGIPLRILIGSERGELASSQDEENWNDRIDERRQDYGETIIRSVVDRLMYVGVLPSVEEYFVDWPDIGGLKDEDRAKVSDLRMKALAAYTNAIGAQDIYPVEFFLQNELGLSPEEVKEIFDSVEKQLGEEEEAEE